MSGPSRCACGDNRSQHNSKRHPTKALHCQNENCRCREFVKKMTFHAAMVATAKQQGVTFDKLIIDDWISNEV